MTILTEGKRAAEFLISEANMTRSREQVTVTVPANTTIPAGQIMAAITATGKYVPHDEDGTDDGTRAPRAVLLMNVTNDTGSPIDVETTMIVRDAEVRAASLTHDAGRTTAEHLADDLADLAAFGVIAR